MSDKIRITDAVLINGEVAKPGVYDREQFTQSTLDWLTANSMVAEVLPDEVEPVVAPPTNVPRPIKRKRPLINDTTQTL